MRKIIITILVGMIIIGSVSAFEDKLADILADVPYQEGQAISVGFITYGNEKVSTPFSLYFSNILERLVLENTEFDLVDKAARELVIDEMMLAMSGLASDDYEITELKLIQVMINGNFFIDGESLIVNLVFVDMADSSILSSNKLVIPLNSLPGNVKIEPDNFSTAQMVLNELSEVQSGEESGLKIAAWTNKGESGVFTDGEKMVINFFSNMDCFIKVYHIDVNGDMSLIFPNPFHSQNFIQKNRVYKIPDGNYGFDFVLGEPFGVEFIKVVASTVQFDMTEESFASLGQVESDVLSRGLTVTKRDAMQTEMQVSYTIIR